VGKEVMVGLLNEDESFSDFIPNNYSAQSSGIEYPEGHFDYIFQKPLHSDVVKSLLIKAREACNNRISGSTNKSNR
jgi:hypothetical protein